MECEAPSAGSQIGGQTVERNSALQDGEINLSVLGEGVEGMTRGKKVGQGM